jgi:hypothetical protein
MLLSNVTGPVEVTLTEVLLAEVISSVPMVTLAAFMVRLWVPKVTWVAPLVVLRPVYAPPVSNSKFGRLEAVHVSGLARLRPLEIFPVSIINVFAAIWEKTEDVTSKLF